MKLGDMIGDALAAVAVARTVYRTHVVVRGLGLRAAPETLSPEARRAYVLVYALVGSEEHYDFVLTLSEQLLSIEKRDLVAHLLNRIAEDGGQRRRTKKEEKP